MDRILLDDAEKANPDIDDSFNVGPRFETPKKDKQLWNTTPRPRKTRENVDGTPLPKVSLLNNQNRDNEIGNSTQLRGFTLSYLRRIPILADMAQRVVEAEAKRRRRDEKQKAKEGKASRCTSQSSSKIAPIKLDAKIKRLFEWIIITLVQEGSMIIWDGPNRAPISTDSDISGLWKANSSTSTIGADSTVFSDLGSDSQFLSQEELANLSDPGPDEPGYMPLSPQLLAIFVEQSMRGLLSVPQPDGKMDGKATKSRPNGKPPTQNVPREGGVTTAQILSSLKMDDQWQNLTDWHVEEALQILHEARTVQKGNNKHWSFLAGTRY